MYSQDQVRSRYYSAQVGAQTQVHSHFLNSHSRTQPGGDQAQDQRLYVLSETRGCHTTNVQTPGCYLYFIMKKPNNTFCQIWESNPGPHAQQSRLQDETNGAVNKKKNKAKREIER